MPLRHTSLEGDMRALRTVRSALGGLMDWCPTDFATPLARQVVAETVTAAEHLAGRVDAAIRSTEDEIDREEADGRAAA